MGDKNKNYGKHILWIANFYGKIIQFINEWRYAKMVALRLNYTQQSNLGGKYCINLKINGLLNMRPHKYKLNAVFESSYLCNVYNK